MDGKLILEDGSIFRGQMLTAKAGAGEVVFNTGMTGYQEVLTDPSYCGQIITLTYPLIGNYGVAEHFSQSAQSSARGFIISELCTKPNNWEMEEGLAEYLTAARIPCLYNVDTRAITRRIRSQGTMRGIIISDVAVGGRNAEDLSDMLAAAVTPDAVREVTTPEIYRLEHEGPHIVVMDFGIKRNILRSLERQGFNLTVVPAFTAAEDVLALQPDGIFLSNGPGDPQDVPEIIATVKKLIGTKPIFGICLGHQLLALAMGGNTYKLKFGHRGSNHPVKDLATGRVYITSQNHGYAVQEDSLRTLALTVTHRAVNDGTIEGMKHDSLPIFSVQYHPEAAPGPDDNSYLFRQFMDMLKGGC